MNKNFYFMCFLFLLTFGTGVVFGHPDPDADAIADAVADAFVDKWNFKPQSAFSNIRVNSGKHFYIRNIFYYSAKKILFVPQWENKFTSFFHFQLPKFSL